MRKGDEIDPKGLMEDAYRIDGISEPECRSIFLDWALSVQATGDVAELIPVLLERHGTEGHPMTEVLREGLAQAAPPRRRGGRRGRV